MPLWLTAILFVAGKMEKYIWEGSRMTLLNLNFAPISISVTLNFIDTMLGLVEDISDLVANL